MNQHSDLEQGREISDWEQRFCLTAWCDAHMLFVRQDSTRPELWHVVTGEEDTEFRVAATTPICPFCGAHLLTAANLEEGLGEPGKQVQTT